LYYGFISYRFWH